MKCGRFIEWRKDAAVEVEKPKTTVGPVVVGASLSAGSGQDEQTVQPIQSEEVGSPDAWLYVSKRLDLEWLPNTSLWGAAALTIGATVYYRLSSAVFVWLEVAGERLEEQWQSGSVAREQIDAYLTAMDVVREFARVNLSGEAVRSQRGRPPVLPDSPQPK